MNTNNYVAYHVHTDLSIHDSATKYQDYIDLCVKYGQKAIAFTEHGNLYQWTAKKTACEAAGIKYIHGCEVYLTEKLSDNPVRDNYHTILLAKNYDGVKELNAIVSKSSLPDHFYYKPRISFDEFLKLSDNIIRISACIASPLNRLDISNEYYERLVRKYNYLEIQAHNVQEQKDYNIHLATLSREYGIPLIAGTDSHSSTKYKAECRRMLQLDKGMDFGEDNDFDLTYKSYPELVQMFRDQNCLPENLFLQAIENTNVLADSIEEFKLDVSFKYPILYGENDREMLVKAIDKGLKDKIASGAVTTNQIEPFKQSVAEELKVFDAIDMSGFMLFMGELVTWCKEHDIPVGFNRGSCGGSRVAYLTNTTDLNPEKWHTVFSRFANIDRKEIGDQAVSPYSNVRANKLVNLQMQGVHST